MITVSDLMREHLQFESETALKESFGDGFLYVKNPVYKRLRTHASELQVKFTRDTELFHYQLCPHLALKEILVHKTVPYFETRRVFQEISKLFPALQIEKIPEVKKNKILHETAHLVAFDILTFRGVPQIQNDFVLAVLIGESFASACESVGRLFSQDPVHNWIYLQNTNAFGCEDEIYRRTLFEITEKHGFDFCFKLALLSFLCWNFFLLSVDTKTFEFLLSICGIATKVPASEKQKLMEFCGFHFRVRNRFRKEIAEFYFKSVGMNAPLSELLSFNFLEVLLKSETWSQNFNSLVSSVADLQTGNQIFGISSSKYGALKAC